MTAAFLIVLGVVLPTLAWLGRQQIKAGIAASPAAVYGQAVVLQLALATLAYATARREQLELAQWFAFNRSLMLDVAAVILFASAVLAMLIGLRHIDDVQAKIYQLLAPRTPTQRLLWIAVCAVVATVEEFVYRGVLVAILQRRLENIGLVLAVSAILFGLAHLLQGWKGFAVTALFAVPLHLLTFSSGTITHAIAIHFTYDVLAGFMIARQLRLNADSPSPRLEDADTE